MYRINTYNIVLILTSIQVFVYIFGHTERVNTNSLYRKSLRNFGKI